MPFTQIKEMQRQNFYTIELSFIFFNVCTELVD